MEGLPIHNSGNELLQQTPSLSDLQVNANMSPTNQQHGIPTASGVNQGWNMDFSGDGIRQSGDVSHSLQYGTAFGEHPDHPSYSLPAGPQQVSSGNENLQDMLQSWLLRPESEGRSQSGSFDLAGAGIFGFDEDHLTARQFAEPSDSSKLSDNIPNERFARVEQCWLTRSSNISRLMRTLWLEVIHTEADNIFHEHCFPSSEAQNKCNQGSRRGVDEECRIRLQNAFSPESSNLGYAANFTADEPGNLSASSPGRVNSDGPIIDSSHGQLSANSFPPAEILDMSLDLYFRHFQPLVPFIHAPTYCAKATPSPMLFAQCLIGLIILGTTGASNFVTKAYPRLLSRISADMAVATMRSATPGSLLTTLANALLMLNLALYAGEREILEQCQMLYVNLITVAQRHGLFTVSEGLPLDPSQLESILDLDQRWKAWSRVESVKR
jgi:hypothetical protein